MFDLYADKTRLTVREREPVTSGSVNAYPVRFTFSPEWEGLDKVAVFYGAGKAVSVVPNESGECTVPWEVLTVSGVHLFAGVQGRREDEVVLPTDLVNLGLILEGAVPGEDARPPTPDLWRQELAQKGDTLGYTRSGNLGLYSGEKLLSEVTIEGGGSGINDHRKLSYRDAEEQHPIEAIIGLTKELNRIPEPVESITNSELEDILK